MTPVVTVVTAAYNAERFLGATVESVLGQTYPDFEHVVVDDGSSDGTAALVEAFAARDPRVRLVRQPNAGAAAARNAGVRAGRGRFVAFLDHDDLWAPEKLARQMARFEADPALGWCYTDAEFFDSATGAPRLRASSEGAPPEGWVFEALLARNFIPFSSVVVRREAFENAGGLSEGADLRHVDDWDLWLRIAPVHRVGYVPAPLLRYRWHAAQATQRMNLEQALTSRLGLLARVEARTPGVAPRRWRRARAEVYVAVGRLQLDRGDTRAARRLFWQALREAPGAVRPSTFILATLLPRALRRHAGRWRRSLS